MEHWNKGGLSREEFLHMREDAMRKLQELAKRQSPAPSVEKAGRAQPHLPKQEAVPAPVITDSAPKAKSQNTPQMEKGGEERPIFQREPLASDPSFPKKPFHLKEPTVEHRLNPDPGIAEEIGAEDFPPSRRAAPAESPEDERSDGFMPSEDLLQTIQNISDTMADAAFSPKDMPGNVSPAETEQTPSVPTSGPPAQAVSLEPVFVPPLPYHPDGFIPGKPGRSPSFHPDAVRPEKGYYRPPRPSSKPPYHLENRWKEENAKKK